MGERYKKGYGLYGRAEADICLTCESKRCLGKCERLKEEKKRLRKEIKEGKSDAT